MNHKSRQQFNQTVGKYFLSFFRPYWWYAGAAALLLFINALIILGLGYAIRHFIDVALTAHDYKFLNLSYIASLFMAFIFAAAAFSRILLTGWLGEKITADIKIKLFQHVLTFDRMLCDQLKMGEIAEHFFTGAQHIQACLSNSFATFFRSVLQVVGATILLWFTSPKLTLLTFLIVPIVIFPIRLMGKSIRRQSNQVQSSQAAVNTFVNECLTGLTDIQLFQNESFIILNFKRHVQTFLEIVKKRLMLRSFLIAAVIFMLFTAIITVIWVGSHNVIAAKMSAGSLTSFVFYAVVVGGSLNQIAELLSEGQNAFNAFERIVNILQLKPQQFQCGRIQNNSISESHTIRFDNISFHYPSRLEHRALNDISFSVPYGQQIAIVGPSGAGKSTLFQLLTRLYEPNEGRILIDDLPLSEMNQVTVRSLFSTVGQNPFLFDSTIYDNVAFGDTTASFENIMHAAEQAGVTEFVQQLSKGFDTVLGENGLCLSNGQKQRLAIARALLRPAPILLMDEATNALDAISEKIIQDILEKIKGQKTVLIIAHRLSTVINADHIIVLDHGNIVEQGTHQHLIKQNGLYKKLATKQFFSID